MQAPKTLQEAICYFSDFENCKSFIVALRWADGTVKCPGCGSARLCWIEKRKLWMCYGKHDHAVFSPKVGTIMEKSSISIDKWLVALWMIVNCKNRISSCETARHLRITQKSAWFMNYRIRRALHSGTIENTGGPHRRRQRFADREAGRANVLQRQQQIIGALNQDQICSENS
jgi:Transposase zinc-ribbon domain